MRFCLAAIALVAIALAQEKQPPEPPVQPIAYSHRQHLALGLKCKNCHEMPDPGEMMGFVAPPVCMQCHSTKLDIWLRLPDHKSALDDVRTGRMSCASGGCHGFAHPFWKPSDELDAASPAAQHPAIPPPNGSSRSNEAR